MQKRNNNGGKMRHGGRRFQNHRNNNRGGQQNDGQNIARQKHHATQMREKYSNMARDAQLNGDVVDMEYYLQHVDHYVRVLSDIAAIEAERFAAREQHFAEAATEGDDAEATEATDASGENAAEGAEADAGKQAAQSGRPQRRSYGSPRPRQPVPAEMRDINPNANTTEIPLPDSVIPQI